MVCRDGGEAAFDLLTGELEPDGVVAPRTLGGVIHEGEEFGFGLVVHGELLQCVHSCGFPSGDRLLELGRITVRSLHDTVGNGGHQGAHGRRLRCCVAFDAVRDEQKRDALSSERLLVGAKSLVAKRGFGGENLFLFGRDGDVHS